MRLPNDVYQMVNDRKVIVFFANRETARYWNENRLGGELRFYTGWYWYEEANGRAVTNEHGPYHSRSAAYKDAAVKLAIKVPAKPAPPKTTQVTGSKVVSLRQYARRKASPAPWRQRVLKRQRRA